MPPVSPDAIDSHKSVRHSFQTDKDFKKLHLSSPKARSSLDIAKESIDAAAAFVSKAGLPGLDRLIATGESSRLILFSMHSENATPPGPRVFGITTSSTTKADEITDLVRPLL